jgi:hypothetical protein
VTLDAGQDRRLDLESLERTRILGETENELVIDDEHIIVLTIAIELDRPIRKSGYTERMLCSKKSCLFIFSSAPGLYLTLSDACSFISMSHDHVINLPTGRRLYPQFHSDLILTCRATRDDENAFQETRTFLFQVSDKPVSTHGMIGERPSTETRQFAIRRRSCLRLKLGPIHVSMRMVRFPRYRSTVTVARPSFSQAGNFKWAEQAWVSS